MKKFNEFINEEKGYDHKAQKAVDDFENAMREGDDAMFKLQKAMDAILRLKDKDLLPGARTLKANRKLHKAWANFYDTYEDESGFTI